MRTETGSAKPPSPCPLSTVGSSAIRTRSGMSSTAPRHLRLSEALSTGRGASRRRPPSVAASGPSLPAALARRAPPTGVRPGGASPARPTRSAGRSHCGRHSGHPASCARACPSGVLACEAVFPSPAVHRRLAALFVLPRSFPCDLACLVCTVQIKIVSIEPKDIRHWQCTKAARPSTKRLMIAPCLRMSGDI